MLCSCHPQGSISHKFQGPFGPLALPSIKNWGPSFVLAPDLVFLILFVHQVKNCCLSIYFLLHFMGGGVKLFPRTGSLICGRMQREDFSEGQLISRCGPCQLSDWTQQEQRGTDPIDYWSVTSLNFLFCISALSWPYFSRTWWKTLTHQIWLELVHGDPRYGHMNI